MALLQDFSKVSSEMGKQLDSLADVVSFGVAPGVILYQLLRISLIREENGLDASVAWLLPAFILSCAAAYRLAKFNLDTEQQLRVQRGTHTSGRLADCFFSVDVTLWWRICQYKPMADQQMGIVPVDHRAELVDGQ
jgi:phosphatidylserine synthase